MSAPSASLAQHTSTCANCGEIKYFVEGVRGPERWRHIRTNLVECEPVCAKCGARGVFKIGTHAAGGDGFNTFHFDHWECGDCASKTCRIEWT
jgi:hypothetical protein